MSSLIINNVACLCLVLVFATSSVFNQRRGQAASSARVRLVTNEPAVYISFTRRGMRKPLQANESDRGIWLRLHNNTKWRIVIPVFDVPPEYGELGVFYDIEVGDKESTDFPNGVPKSRPVDEVYSIISLGPGKSVSFSVPQEHLENGLNLRVRFSYDWENQDDVFAGREAIHFVYFRSSMIPKPKS